MDSEYRYFLLFVGAIVVIAFAVHIAFLEAYIELIDQDVVRLRRIVAKVD